VFAKKGKSNEPPWTYTEAHPVSPTSGQHFLPVRTFHILEAVLHTPKVSDRGGASQRRNHMVGAVRVVPDQLREDAMTAEKDARIAALEAQNKLWQQNMREAYEAFSAMRNDLNELFPMQSAEADLLEGTEWSIACSAIVDSARNKFSTLETQLAEAAKERDYWQSQHDERTRQLGISALEATPPAPKVTDVAIDELAYRFWSVHPRDLDEWVKSAPSMPDGYRGGIRAWFFACEIRRAITAAQEVGE
jgi:hypothetical protein